MPKRQSQPVNGNAGNSDFSAYRELTPTSGWTTDVVFIARVLHGNGILGSPNINPVTTPAKNSRGDIAQH